MNILITGVAGFIGSALALKLLSQGKHVVGIDNLNNYYDVRLKKSRLLNCQQNKSFKFYQNDITHRTQMEKLFSENNFDKVVHLAAQPGVRYSIENPHAYIEANLVGFSHILEVCRHHQIKHLIYASSSSVYGANVKLPFSEHDATDHPLSLYGATKKANELMAHSYAHLYHLPCTGLRFFTVYGPWCRPDMALFNFTRHILENRPIQVFNHGKMMRDFTYIDDLVEGISRTINILPGAKLSVSHEAVANHTAPYQIYNIGNHRPIQLMRYIEVLEQCLSKKAILEMRPMQAGDLPETYADMNSFEKIVGALPHTPIEVGILKFVEWYQMYAQQ